MKTTIVLILILAASLSHAAGRINFSVKTGQRLGDDAECPELTPIRQARISVDVNQLIVEKDPQDGSISMRGATVCKDFKGMVPVYKVPDNVSCFSTISPTFIDCNFTDNSASQAKAQISGYILQQGNEKTFTAFMSTAQQAKYDSGYNGVTVFDLNINKLLMNVSNDRLGSEDGKVYERLQANVLFEDAQP